MSIAPVPPEMIKRMWPVVLPWLEAAMEHGPQLYGADDVREACEMKRMFLWVAISEGEPIGMTVTSVEEYPLMTVAAIKWGGGIPGRGDEWIGDMIETLKQWGRSFGARLLGGMGRKGWLRGFGFRDGGVIFEMDLAQ